MILLDSITRLARANNLVTPPTGRTLSGGLDSAALYFPKRFLGAARNIRGGGASPFWPPPLWRREAAWTT